MRKFKLVAFGLLCLSSTNAFSAQCAQLNNELSGLVGMADNAEMIYVRVTSSTNNCSCHEFLFTAGNTNTDRVLSILLSAKMASKKVRVDLLDGADCNSAFRVYIQ